MSAFGLCLIGAVAVLTILTGLPAYSILLLGAVTGAATGLATGAINIDILRGVTLRLLNLLENDLLQALPLFMLMGALLRRLPVTSALFKSGTKLFGGGRSAPVLSGFLLGALLGPMNGSVGASVGALARILGPQLRAAGVAPASQEAVVAVAGTLGVVVPPSLVLILLGDAMLTAHTYAMNATNRLDRVMNTQDLMRGALLPAGLFLAACLAGAALTSPALRGPKKVMELAFSEIATAAVTLAFLLLLLGGVAVGRFYAVEAAAMGAVVLFLAALVSGRLTGGTLPSVVNEVLVGTGTLFAPLLAATTFTLVLRALGTDKLIEAGIAGLGGGQVVPVIAILAGLAVLAFALDAFEIIFVAVPILVPALLIRVEDAVWIGVLVLLVLQTSFLLPPMGYAWVLARAMSPGKAAASKTLKALLPFLLGQVIVLSLVIAVPSLVHVLDPPAARPQPSPEKGASDGDALLRQLQGATPGLPVGPPRF
jgi:tripartite ATP-independent transporter DctM subunit